MSKLFQQLLEIRRKSTLPAREQKKGEVNHLPKLNKEHAMKRVNTFVDIDTELVEGSEIREEESSSKTAGVELEEEPIKKQKVDDDKEREDLQQCFELVTEEDVAINVIPLATKPAPIVNFQIHRKGRNGYYEIIRADGSAKTYLLFSQMLKMFDRQDLENLWSWLKGKHGYTRPEWKDMKRVTMERSKGLV
ncbi:hypothetical protein Tco_0713831 [Tanacetum coccineum]